MKKRSAHPTHLTRVSAVIVALFVTFGSVTPAAAAPQEAVNIVASLNASRADVGKSAMVMSEKLNAVAQAWAATISREKFVHNPAVGSQIPAGYRGWAENIAWSTNGDGAAFHTMWMNSPGHKANMMGDYNYIGVGWHVSAAGERSGVQVFGKYSSHPDGAQAAPPAPPVAVQPAPPAPAPAQPQPVSPPPPADRKQVAETPKTAKPDGPPAAQPVPVPPAEQPPESAAAEAPTEPAEASAAPQSGVTTRSDAPTDPNGSAEAANDVAPGGEAVSDGWGAAQSLGGAFLILFLLAAASMAIPRVRRFVREALRKLIPSRSS